MKASACTRRGFLQLGGVGLVVAIVPGTITGCALPVIPKRPRPDAEDALGWVRHLDGRTTLFIPRVEMGQNILTALKQIVCLEMGVPWDTVDARLHGTRDITRVRATVGSESIKDFAVPLAQACATLREALAEGRMQGPLRVTPRPLADLRFLQAGRTPAAAAPVYLEQGRAIVRGEPLYVADIRRPGMLFGRVLRAPASPERGSRSNPIDEAAARTVPGFVAVVRDPLLTVGEAEGVGIVARTPGALDRVEQALGLTWVVEPPAFEQSTIDAAIDIDRRLAAHPRRSHPVQDDRVEPDGAWDVDLRIDVPLAAHAPIEPRAAVAEFDPTGTLQLWVGSQDVFYQRDVMVRRLGLTEEKVLVYGQRVGGSFGGKTICTVELEAAVLARAAGAPIKVQWTRAQEFRQCFHRPPSSHRIRVRLDKGRLKAWWHSFASSHILFTAAVVPPWLQHITDFIDDDGVARGALLPYRAGARRVEFDLVRLPVYTGPWRGLGAGPNVFAIESAMDECARHVGADPVQFRLEHIGDERLSAVLRRVAEASDWGQPLQSTPPLRRGRGVACGIYKAMSYAAVVADVEVDASTGQVRVLKLWCAHDCGRMVNPDQVRAQCEGNLVWGIGMVLLERLPVAGSQVAASSFADSPIPRLPDVPPMEVVLLDSEHPPTGAGETAIVAGAAAIANAIRDAVGVRPQQLPVQAGVLQQMMAQMDPAGLIMASRPTKQTP